LCTEWIIREQTVSSTLTADASRDATVKCIDHFVRSDGFGPIGRWVVPTVADDSDLSSGANAEGVKTSSVTDVDEVSIRRFRRRIAIIDNEEKVIERVSSHSLVRDQEFTAIEALFVFVVEKKENGAHQRISGESGR
jgi:hypothetical protein